MLNGFGIVLLVAGALVVIAVGPRVAETDLSGAGWFLMLAGVVSIMAAAVVGLVRSSASGNVDTDGS